MSIFVAEWQMGYVWGGIYQRQQHCFLEFKWRPFSLWSDPSNLKSLLTKEVAVTILLRQPSKLLLIGEPLCHSTPWNHWRKTTHPLLWNIYLDKLIPCYLWARLTFATLNSISRLATAASFRFSVILLLCTIKSFSWKTGFQHYRMSWLHEYSILHL